MENCLCGSIVLQTHRVFDIKLPIIVCHNVSIKMNKLILIKYIVVEY